jgi:alkylated DNA repair protein (DNA oxidative demethylase)
MCCRWLRELREIFGLTRSYRKRTLLRTYQRWRGSCLYEDREGTPYSDGHLLKRANVFAAQSDLFDRPRLAGLAQAEAFVTESEEEALIVSIESVELSPFRFHGWLGKRLTASFGWRYDFDDANFARTDSIPEWLLPLRERAAQFALLSPDEFVQALLIRYDPGAGIGWHRDRPVFEHVIGVSLGAPATMRFRRRKPGGFDRASAELPPRSIYHLSGEARHRWEHSIADMAVTRWSITFRSLSEEGRRHRGET